MKQFLLASKSSGSSRKTPYPPVLDMAQLISLSTQLATGMQYIANMRYVHGDLGTRSLLISSTLTLKISNPGISIESYIPALPRDTVKEYCLYRNKVSLWIFSGYMGLE